MTKLLFSIDYAAELKKNPPDILFYDEKLKTPLFKGLAIPVKISESSKSLSTVEYLWEKMVGLNRSSTVVFMGGGTLLDVGGFAASTFMRGIASIYIPTTLLSMIDACYGGKTAFNYRGIKNLIGTFHPAKEIWFDSQLLSSLSARDFNSGMAEAIKIAIIYDESFFDELEAGLPLDSIIQRALLLKKEIVELDPVDKKGIRALLNLGHTFAHALETATDYSTLTHGEAVAHGIMLASTISGLDENSHHRIESLLKKYQLLPKLPLLDPYHLVNLMRKDKKNSHGNIALILPEKIGKAAVHDSIEPEQIINIFRGYFLSAST